MSEQRVVDLPEARRFEVLVDGERAGLAAYRLRADRIVFLHTEIDDAHEGRGLGGVLVRAALDSARERGLRVVPICPFVKGWIERHPDYADLVA
ncbi:MAG TPA: GNAT family N-acetyltransferase [Pseudonocardia sp.]|jgi:predicted GNAT family acetyltransferase|nr:GNAT family N-acetyltransferase [Pseudonocardia sp.]